jgi:hypothetical protein
MTLEEIRAEARRHDWTHGQVLFLADRIRNALVVLGCDGAAVAARKEAMEKLLATIEAIEASHMTQVLAPVAPEGKVRHAS